MLRLGFDHQAQRRRQGGEHRLRMLRGLLKVVFCLVTMSHLPNGSFRGRSVGTDLDGGHGGFRHRQHEVWSNGADDRTPDGANVEMKVTSETTTSFIFGSDGGRSRGSAGQGIDSRETLQAPIPSEVGVDRFGGKFSGEPDRYKPWSTR